MSWLGKVVGGVFGFVMGGPLGAVLGATVGHRLDQEDAEIRLEGLGSTPEEAEAHRRDYFIGVFQVMGYMAKVDGWVSESEIRVARNIMDRMSLTDELKFMAMRLFNDGKDPRFSLTAALRGVRDACTSSPHHLRIFIALQLEVATADGAVSDLEEATLQGMCDQLGFSRYEYFGIKTRLEAQRRFGGGGAGASGRRTRYFYQEYNRQQTPQSETINLRSELRDAYDALQLRPLATEAEVKKAYRRLISRHHPDKLVGQSPSAVQAATERTQSIQKSYELICKARGF